MWQAAAGDVQEHRAEQAGRGERLQKQSNERARNEPGSAKESAGQRRGHRPSRWLHRRQAAPSLLAGVLLKRHTQHTRDLGQNLQKRVGVVGVGSGWVRVSMLVHGQSSLPADKHCQPSARQPACCVPHQTAKLLLLMVLLQSASRVPAPTAAQPRPNHHSCRPPTDLWVGDSLAALVCSTDGDAKAAKQGQRWLPEEARTDGSRSWQCPRRQRHASLWQRPPQPLKLTLPTARTLPTPKTIPVLTAHTH